jgi:hypothetical protein
MSDVYTIGMRLVLAGNAVHGLQQISQLLGGIHGHVGRIHAGFRGWAAVLGVGAVGAGVGIIGGLKHAMEHAKELSKELTTIQNYGVSDAQRAATQARAQQLSVTIPGVTQSGALHSYGNMYSIIGHDRAMLIWEKMLKFEQALGATVGYDKAKDASYAMIRAGDIMGKLVDEKTGKVDTNKLQGFLEIANKVNTISHGKISPSEILQMAKQGSAGFKSIEKDEDLMPWFMAAQGMGGARVGTAVMSMYQQMVGGKMTESTARHLQELGLVGAYTKNQGGGVDFRPGSLDQPWIHELTKGDAFKGVEMLKGTLEAHGKDSNLELFKIIGKTTVIRLMQDIMSNLPQMMEEAGRAKGVVSIDQQLANNNSGNIITAEHNLSEAWKNLMESVAGPNSKAYIAILNEIAGAFRSLSDYLNKLPQEKLTDIFHSIGVLGLSLAGAGGAALLAALGPAGWMVLGVGAMTATFIAFRKEIIESEFAKKLGEEFALISKGLSIFFGFLQGMWEKFKDWMVGHGLWGKGDGPTTAPGGGSWDAMGNYTPGMIHKESYHPDGGANDNYRGASLGHAMSRGKQATYQQIYDMAKRAGDPFPEVTAAQAMHETGWGRHLSGANNYFGQKARAGESGRMLATHEAWGLTHSRFKNYGSLEEGVADHVRRWSRLYKGAQSPEEAVRILKRHGYATDPHYVGKVMGIINNSQRSRKAITEGVTPPPRKQSQPIIQFDAHLDGEVLSRTTTRRQSRMAMFPTSSGDIDPHGRYHDAGTRFSDVG